MADDEALFAVAQVAADDDDLVLIDSDKPGFHKWADALTSREIHKVPESCIGKWLSAERLVELTQQRGKKHSTIGFVRGGVKLLHPEEALYLLDEGTLFLTPLMSRKAAPAQPPAAAAPPPPEVPPADGVDAPGFDAAGSGAAGAPPVDAPASAAAAAPSSDAAAPAAATSSAAAADATAAASADAAALGKRRRPVTSPDAEAYMPFQQAYELLMRNSDPRVSLTYSLLRSQGLVPLRHRKYATAADDVDPGPQPPRRRLLLPTPHDEPLLEPVFDVYARDGISSFKPSAPGAPDFYVCIARCVRRRGALL